MRMKLGVQSYKTVLRYPFGLRAIVSQWRRLQARPVMESAKWIRPQIYAKFSNVTNDTPFYNNSTAY